MFSSISTKTFVWKTSISMQHRRRHHAYNTYHSTPTSPVDDSPPGSLVTAGGCCHRKQVDPTVLLSIAVLVSHPSSPFPPYLSPPDPIPHSSTRLPPAELRFPPTTSRPGAGGNSCTAIASEAGGDIGWGEEGRYPRSGNGSRRTPGIQDYSPF